MDVQINEYNQKNGWYEQFNIDYYTVYNNTLYALIVLNTHPENLIHWLSTAKTLKILNDDHNDDHINEFSTNSITMFTYHDVMTLLDIQNNNNINIDCRCVTCNVRCAISKLIEHSVCYKLLKIPNLINLITEFFI